MSGKASKPSYILIKDGQAIISDAADLWGQDTYATVDTLNFGEVQVQNFGTSRDVLIRLPVRGDVKQADVVTRVFDALCKAENASTSRTSPISCCSDLSVPR